MQPTSFINHGGGPCVFNMRGLGAIAVPSIPPPEAFDARLREAMADGDTRARSLIGWARAPGAPSRRSRTRITCCR